MDTDPRVRRARAGGDLVHAHGRRRARTGARRVGRGARALALRLVASALIALAPGAKAQDEATHAPDLVRLRAAAESDATKGVEYLRACFDALADTSAEEPDATLEARAAEARAAARRYGSAHHALTIEVQVASAWRDRGRSERALEGVRTALATFPESTDGSAFLLLAGGLCAQDLGRDLEALELLGRVERSVAGATTDEELDAVLCDALTARADVWTDRGAPERALEEIERASTLAVGYEQRSTFLRASFRASKALADVDRCMELLREAERLARENGVDVPAWIAMYRGTMLLERVGRSRADAARACAELASVLDASEVGPLERVHASLLLASAELADARFDAAARSTDAAEESLAELGPQRASAASFQSIDAACRVASSRVRHALASGASADALLGRVERLRDRWRALLVYWRAQAPTGAAFGPLHWSNARGPLGTLIDGEIALAPGVAGRERAFRHALDAQTIGSISRRLGVERCSIEELRRECLGPDAGALAFVPGDGATHAFWLDATTVEHARLPDEPVLRSARRELSRWLAAPADASRDDSLDAWRVRARAASAAVLPEALREWIRRERDLQITGLAFVGGAGIEALTLDGDEPLGATSRVTVQPSLAVALALARRRASRLEAEDARDACWVLAPAIGADVRARHPELETIACSLEDRDALERWTREARRTTFLGERATPTALLAAVARPTRALFFLGHVVPDPGHELGGALVLSDADGSDGLVRPATLETRRLASFVALLGCRSASGRTHAGDDASMPLADACFVGGADSVLVAARPIRWDTAHAVALDLASAFADGASPAESVRRARAARRAAGGDVREWLSISLVGAGDEPSGWTKAPLPSEEAAPSRVAWLVSGGAAIGLGVLLWLGGRRRNARRT